MPMKLTWDVVTHVADEQRIYRSTQPIDENNLPSPVATLPPEQEEHIDEGPFDIGTTYHYRVSAVKGELESVSQEASMIYWEGDLSSPLDLGGCLLWLDAEDFLGSLQNGAPIEEWPDKSGNNHHFTQPTSRRRPTFTESKAEMLDRPMIFFNQSSGDNQHLNGQHQALQFNPDGPGQTILYIAYLGQARGTVYAWREGGNIGFQALQQPNARPSYYGHGGLSIQPDIEKPYSAQLVTILHPPTTSGKAGQVRGEMHSILDGIATDPTATLPSQLDPIRIGARGDGNGGVTFLLTGHIGEIIVYNRVLTDVELRAAEKYLMDKWFPARAPLDIGSVFHYHRAEDLSLSDGDPVTLWPDATGNGHDCTPDSTPPVYRASGQGGLPYLEFDGSNKLNIGGDEFTTSTASNIGHSVFIVSRSGPHEHIANTRHIINGRAGIGFRGNGIAMSISVTPAPQRRTFPTDDLDPEKAYAFIGSMQGTEQPTLYWTGEVQGATSSNNRWNAGQGPYIADDYTGEIYEIALFDRVLTSAEIQCLTQYARDKYQL